jgi:hypothetical protein
MPLYNESDYVAEINEKVTASGLAPELYAEDVLEILSHGIASICDGIKIEMTSRGAKLTLSFEEGTMSDIVYYANEHELAKISNAIDDIVSNGGCEG